MIWLFLLIPLSFLAFFGFAVFAVVKILNKGKEWNKKLENGSFKQELRMLINQRIQKNSISRTDITTSRIIKGTYINKKILSDSKFSYFNDLYSDNDLKKPAAITEMRYTLSFPGLANLNGITITKTVNSEIIMEIKKGFMHIYLNEKYLGVIDLFKKEIRKNEQILGTLDFPDLFMGGVTSVNWHIIFNGIKSADIIAAHNFKDSIVANIPDTKVKFAEIFNVLTKEQMAFVISMILFLKIHRSLSPN